MANAFSLFLCAEPNFFFFYSYAICLHNAQRLTFESSSLWIILEVKFCLKRLQEIKKISPLEYIGACNSESRNVSSYGLEPENSSVLLVGTVYILMTTVQWNKKGVSTLFKFHFGQHYTNFNKSHHVRILFLKDSNPSHFVLPNKKRTSYW